MKPNIHPEYRPVAFIDLSINKTFIIPSSVQTRETTVIDGVTYPLFKLDTSSASHPFYTGAQTRSSARSSPPRSRRSTPLPKPPSPPSNLDDDPRREPPFGETPPPALPAG